MSDPEHPSVSVVIAAYNAGPYLARAVDSALAQTGVAVEVIVVDDCSTDATLANARAMAEADPRVRVFSNAENAGPGATRNRALAEVRHDWVAILDADDAYTPERLARLVAAAEAEGVDAIGDLPVYYDLAAEQAEPDQPTANGGVSRLGVADFLEPDADSGVDLGLMQPVFRADLAHRGVWRYPDQRHGEDFALVVGLLRQGVSFALLREAHYLYSTRVGAITGAYSPGSVTRVDYNALAESAAALLEDMTRAGDLDARSQTLLSARITRARRQNRIYGWTTLRRGYLGRWWRWLWADPRNRRDMAAVLAQKLTGRRGLPE